MTMSYSTFPSVRYRGIGTSYRVLKIVGVGYGCQAIGLASIQEPAEGPLSPKGGILVEVNTAFPRVFLTSYYLPFDSTSWSKLIGAVKHRMQSNGTWSPCTIHNHHDEINF